MCSCSIVFKEKRTNWKLRIFTFNNKNPLYLPLILIIQFFEGQSHHGVIQLVIKRFGIPKILQIVSLSKKSHIFSTFFNFSFIILGNTSHKFWDRPLHYQCVCKYLRQFVGTSRGFATCPTWRQHRCLGKQFYRTLLN